MIDTDKTWFRANISPYLDRIKEEFKSLSIHVNRDIGFKPIVDSINPPKITVRDREASVIIKGNLFTESIRISSDDADIYDVKLVDENTVSLGITLRQTTPDKVKLKVGNLYGSIYAYLDTPRQAWLDFRADAKANYTVEAAKGTKIKSYNLGLSYSGKPWGGWFRISSLMYPRSAGRTISFILKPNGTTFMAGLFSEKQDGNSGTQYYEFETAVYSNSNTIKGFYGTDKNHSGKGKTNLNISFKDYLAVKIVLTNNAEAGSAVYFYGLKDLDDLDNESNLLATESIPSVFTANGETLYPGLVCSSKLRTIAIQLK
jgi:hypothetical protein